MSTAGNWEVGEVRRTRKISQEMDDGTTEVVRVNIDRVDVEYLCEDGSTESIMIVRTRQKHRCLPHKCEDLCQHRGSRLPMLNLTWPDGHSEGSTMEHLFYVRFAERFGIALTEKLMEEMS